MSDELQDEQAIPEMYRKRLERMERLYARHGQELNEAGHRMMKRAIFETKYALRGMSQ